MLINSYRFLKNLELLYSLRKLDNTAIKGISVRDSINSSDLDINFNSSGELDYSSMAYNTYKKPLISEAIYNNTVLDISNEETRPQGTFFSPQGSRLYICGLSTNRIHQYNLTTPWDISTANLNSSATLNDSAEEIFFSPNGKKLYTLEGDKCNSYDLTSSWDIPSGTLSITATFDFNREEPAPTGIYFSPSGYRLYMVGLGANSIFQYDLTTAWDISDTVTLNNSIFVLTEFDTQIQQPRSIFFSPDGFKYYIVESQQSSIQDYNVTTAWDISSSTWNSTFDLTNEQDDATSFFFSPDSSRLYVIGRSLARVHKYNLPSPWNTPLSFVYDNKVLNVDSSDINIDDNFGTESLSFSTDGFRLYLIYNNTKTNSDPLSLTNFIYQYDLTTAWNISDTVTLNGTYNVDMGSGPNTYQDTLESINFSPDGLRFYIVIRKPFDKDRLDQYDLTTAWDISTASTNGSFEIDDRYSDGRQEESFAKDVFISPDGLKLYIIETARSTSNIIYQYDLTTAWDISGTVTLRGSLSIDNEDTAAQSLYFSPTGLELYILGKQNKIFYLYNLTTAWDITDTVTFNSSWDFNDVVNFNGTLNYQGKSTSVKSMFISPDGSRLYLLIVSIQSGSNLLEIYQYDYFNLSLSSIYNQNPDSNSERDYTLTPLSFNRKARVTLNSIKFENDDYYTTNIRNISTVSIFLVIGLDKNNSQVQEIINVDGLSIKYDPSVEQLIVNTLNDTISQDIQIEKKIFIISVILSRSGILFNVNTEESFSPGNFPKTSTGELKLGDEIFTGKFYELQIYSSDKTSEEPTIRGELEDYYL